MNVQGHTLKFPRSKRLLTAQDYDSVFKARNKIYSDGFILFYKSNSIGTARLGLAIAKKHVPTAVIRNRIKRISRETFRKHSDLECYDVVIIVRSALKKPTRAKLQASLKELWQGLTTRIQQDKHRVPL